MTEALNEQARLHLKTSRDNLHADFDTLLSPSHVDTVFDDSIARIHGKGRFDDYVPALAEKLARERLKAAAQSEGLLKKNVPNVLFVALHDTGRGQMGAAIMRTLAGERINVQSAGTRGDVAPVDPGVAKAMEEIGIELAGTYSKPLTPEVLQAADVVVTMSKSTGQFEIPEGVRHVDWRLGDPGGAPPDEIRRIREDIKARVQALIDELAPN
jgi:protein-tyrosine-phosphatase